MKTKTLKLRAFRGLYIYAEGLSKPCSVLTAFFGIYPDDLSEDDLDSILEDENDYKFYYWFSESEFKHVQIGSLIDGDGTWLLEMDDIYDYELEVPAREVDHV